MDPPRQIKKKAKRDLQKMQQHLDWLQERVVRQKKARKKLVITTGNQNVTGTQNAIQGTNFIYTLE